MLIQVGPYSHALASTAAPRNCAKLPRGHASLFVQGKCHSFIILLPSWGMDKCPPPVSRINVTATATLGSKTALGLAIPNKQAGTNATISIGAGAILGLSPWDWIFCGEWGDPRPPVGRIGLVPALAFFLVEQNRTINTMALVGWI